MRLLASVCVALMLVGCSERGPTESAPEHDGVIRAGSGPIAFVAQRLAGEGALVELPVPEGADPATWRPGFDVIADYQGSMLIVLNGAGFEQWAESAALPNSRVVRTAGAAGIELIPSEAVTHTHGTEGAHSHGAMNPHTWMSPQALASQARALAEVLSNAMPGEAGAINARLEALAAELGGLSEQWRGVETSGVRFAATHPSYDYLWREMGWAITNLSLDPDAPIEGEAWLSLESLVQASDEPLVLLWESEPLEQTARRLREELGTGSVVIDPAEGGPIGDYLEVQRANMDRLARAVAAARGE